MWLAKTEAVEDPKHKRDRLISAGQAGNILVLKTRQDGFLACSGRKMEVKPVFKISRC